MTDITIEFARRDDCLDKMVPSDLRLLVAERDQLRAELAATMAQEPVGYTTWGMVECIKALPFTGRIGVRAEKTARWNIPLYAATPAADAELVELLSEIRKMNASGLSAHTKQRIDAKLASLRVATRQSAK